MTLVAMSLARAGASAPCACRRALAGGRASTGLALGWRRIGSAEVA